MRILVVGGGGREHALCWSIAASPLCDALFCAPGNAGIAEQAQCVPIAADNIARLVAYAREQRIDFVVVGPEGPLVLGLVDRLREAGIPTFGPNADAAALEGSKGFMKDLCARYRIPTAAYARFREAAAARAYVESRPLPIVVKADGLAAGKGVVIAETREQVISAIDSMLVGNVFGSAGAEVVIEEFMGGEEVSIFALTDGKTALALASAQDHKRVGDGDTGPNTGGMGAYSPAPAASAAVEESVMARIIRPTVAAMAAEGKPFKGVLYAGIMLTAEGPKLLEYNVRFGDPETQVLCPRLKSDLLPALIACHDGMLDQIDLRWMSEAALTVVMAANGYPGSYAKGSEIRGLAEAGKLPGVTIFHAGTKRDSDGRLLAEGGRVLNVTALGATVAEAQKRAYAAIDRIDWPGGFCRRDIGWRALEPRS
ncbi:MAG TPA: phosphoribosylamine--glycine ligase [Candidatus Polarisedimenticolia bacterium]|nr:phosphoribosylamine--glycine ligase [Candidatus Polarisedimenticolia bacterium]